MHGVLVLDKPLGFSSNQALQKVKWLYQAAKAGHTGALDPLATGVLPLCFGEATKFSQYLLDADKRYTATFQLGLETQSGDLDSPVVSETDASGVSQSDVERAIENFRGDIEQLPPMYSALKHQGQPLYKLARDGIEVERQPRPVTIYEYQLVAFRPGAKAEVDVSVHCSKGTYIRTLATDLGYGLGVGSTVTALRRTQAGPFSLNQAQQLDDLISKGDAAHAAREAQGEDVSNQAWADMDALLAPVDIAIEGLAKIELAANSCHYFQQGQAVMEHKVYQVAREGDKVRVFSHTGLFLGVGEVDSGGCIAPKRLVVM